MPILAMAFCLLRHLRQPVRRHLLARHNLVVIVAVDNLRLDLAERFRIIRTLALLDAKHATVLTHSQPNFSVVSTIVINVEHPPDPTICQVELCVAHQRIPISLSNTRSAAVRNGLTGLCRILSLNIFKSSFSIQTHSSSTRQFSFIHCKAESWSAHEH